MFKLKRGDLPSLINILVLSDIEGTIRASEDNSINAVLLEFEESERGTQAAKAFEYRYIFNIFLPTG